MKPLQIFERENNKSVRFDIISEFFKLLFMGLNWPSQVRNFYTFLNSFLKEKEYLVI